MGHCGMAQLIVMLTLTLALSAAGASAQGVLTPCQCVYLSGTKGYNWGTFRVSSHDVRLNSSECVLIFITGTSLEIVELRFEDLQLRQRCQDQISLFPHLKEAIVTDFAKSESVICRENMMDFIYKENTVPNKLPDKQQNKDNDVNATREMEPFILEQGSIFSSGRIMAIRLRYDKITANTTSFDVMGKFRFLDKVSFKTDGNLLPKTFCDYQHLPIITTEATNQAWRDFYSPRYPAKYPDHIKCSYRFIGRPTQIVEIVFKEIHLSVDNKSCIQQSDKITVYDSKNNDKSAVIDVFCTKTESKKVISSGPYLLVEFESSSNETANGFSGQFRFLSFNAQPTKLNITASDTQVHPDVVQQDNPVAVDNNVSNKERENATMALGDVGDPHHHHHNADIHMNGELLTHNVIDEDEYAAAVAGNSSGRAVMICPPGSTCDQVLHSVSTPNGTITSPLFPGPYPSQTFCRYEFQGGGRERVQIKFSEFSLPSEGDSEDCDDADTLTILYLIGGKYEPIEVLCGETIPKPIMSNGPQLLFEFRGRQSGKGNRGFKADYQFLQNYGIVSGKQKTNSECTFTYNSSVSKNGYFDSPNYPGAYPRNIQCNYLFYGQLGDKVVIRFIYFDVEGVLPCEESTASDYVELSNFMSRDRKFGRYCERHDSFSVKSDGKFFRVTFRSNDRLDATGFRATYDFKTENPTTELPNLQTISGNHRSSYASSNCYHILIVIVANFIGYLTNNFS